VPTARKKQTFMPSPLEKSLWHRTKKGKSEILLSEFGHQSEHRPLSVGGLTRAGSIHHIRRPPRPRRGRRIVVSRICHHLIYDNLLPVLRGQISSALLPVRRNRVGELKKKSTKTYHMPVRRNRVGELEKKEYQNLPRPARRK
jgi:hypothetical protein